MSYSITTRTTLWLTISGVIVGAALIAFATLGLHWGIDFTGGTLWEVQAPGSELGPVRDAVQTVVADAVVQTSGEQGFLVRAPLMDEATHQQALTAIRAASPEATDLRFDAVGPAVGQELLRASLVAILVLMFLIGCYIAWAFRKVSSPVASWKYGVLTGVAALHDVILPVGVFAVLGAIFGWQVDTAFVAALLTILGYSINDTIVVFDRVRENLFRMRHARPAFSEVVDQSIRETLGRSLNTTFTTLLPLIAIAIFGAEGTRPFVIALIIGIVSGAYSSIFVASPLLALWERRGAHTS